MGYPDTSWAENDSWDSEIEAHFEAKLKRARRKPEYLSSQARHLVRTRPDVALQLIERAYEQPDQSLRPVLDETRAQALLALGRRDDAVAALEDSLEHEKESVFGTSAYLRLPFVVALGQMTDYYPRAVSILLEYAKRPMWPVEHFQWHAAYALIAADMGDSRTASGEAGAALEAAGTQESVFRYHRKLGLVGREAAPLLERLEALRDA